MDNETATIDLIIPPLPKGYKKISKENNLPPLPAGYTPIKKKEYMESTSTIQNQNLDLETNTGSSVGKNTKIKKFEGFSVSDMDSMQGIVAPKINEKIVETLNPTVAKIRNLDNSINRTIITDKNALQVNNKISEREKLRQQNETEKDAKTEALGNSLFDKIYSYDQNISLQNLENEKNDNQFVDYAREIGKGAVNIASDALNATTNKLYNKGAEIVGLSEDGKPFFPEFDKFSKFKPLEKAKQKALQNNPDLINDVNALQLETEKVYLQEDAKRQYQKNAEDILKNEDPEIQELVKTNQIKKARIQDFQIKSNVVQIQLLGGKYENLAKEYNRNPTKENFEVAKQLQKKYIDILNEQSQLINSNNDVQQNIELFKLNYNPYDKFLNGVASSTTKMVGGAMALSAELSPIQSLFPNATKKYAEAGRDLVDIANENDSKYRRISIEDVEATGELGRYISQLFSEQVSNLLVASTGYGGLAMLGAGSGGQKTIEMRKEMELDPKRYSEAQVKVAGIAFALAEAIPEVNTLNIVKGAKNAIKSIATNVAERTLFQKGIKEFAIDFTKDVVVKGGINGIKEGLSENFTGIMQDAIDEKFLDNKVDNKLGKRTEEFYSGFILGGGISAFAESSAFVGYVLSKVSTEKEMQDVKNRIAKINQLEVELQKEDLFQTDIDIIKKDLDLAYVGLKNNIVNNSKTVQNLSKIQIEELVKTNVRQVEIRKEFEVLKNGNLSKEIKEAKAEELKQEFIKNEESRNGIKTGKIFSVELLPLQEQDQIKRQALEDLVTELNPDGSKDITISNQQIVERANTIYNESLNNENNNNVVQENNINKNEQNAEAENTVTKTKDKTEVQEQTESTKKVIENPTEISELQISLNIPDITELEYKDFIDNENVKEKRLLDIAEKVKTNNKLSDKETAIFTAKTSEINDLIAKDFVVQDNVVKNNEVVENNVFNDKKQTTEKVNSKPFITTAKYKLSDKDQEFKVFLKNGLLKVTNAKGKSVLKNTERKILQKHAQNFDFTIGDKAVLSNNINQSNIKEFIINESNNASQIAQVINTARFTDIINTTIDERLDYKQSVIADNLGKIKAESFYRNGDRNTVTKSIKANYFDKSGKGDSLDTLAQEMSEQAGIEITENDIVEFILENPGGSNSFYTKEKRNVNQLKKEKANNVKKLKEKFTQITGFPATNELLLKAIEQENIKSEYNSKLDNMSDAELIKLENEIKQFESENYGDVKQVTEGNNQIEGDTISREKSEVQGTTNKKTKQERIDIASAKVDDVFNAISGIDSIFGIKIKIDNVDGLNKNGIDIVSVIASIVKQAVVAGIEIDEAIAKTIAHLKQTLDFDVDVEDIKIALQIENNETNLSKKEQRLKEKIINYPKKGEFQSYLSQDTMESAHGVVQKDEGYDALILVQVGEYGQDLVKVAYELYAENYISKLLNLIDNNSFRLDEKALVLISLENHIAERLKNNPNDGQLNKLQALVQSKSKVVSNTGSRIINFGRLRNIMKIGFDVEGQGEKILSDTARQKKKKVKKIINEVNSKKVNKQAELELNEEQDVEDFVIAIPKTKRNVKTIDKEIADVLAKIKAEIKANNRNLGMSVLPYQNQILTATPYVVKLSKLFAEKQIYNTKEIINNIYESLKDTFPSLKQEDIKTLLQQKAREGKKQTPEEIESKKIANRIKNTEQKISDLENSVQKDNTGKSSEWSKELSEAKSKLALLQQKAREGKISNVVKQALIEASFGRTINVNTKNGKQEVEVLDWNLLAGEESSVDSIEKNVLSVLKNKFTNDELLKINNQLQEEYNRLSAKIIEKGINDLERGNKILPNTNIKKYSKRIAELYNKGLFESDEYGVLLNKVLGLSSFELEAQQKIKEQAQALADLYTTKLPNGKRLSELAISNIASDITNNINDIIATISRQEGGKLFNTVQFYGDVAVMSQKAMLGGIGNLIENYTSAKWQGLLTQELVMKGKLTPELKKQIQADKDVIWRDINNNGGLFYGDTNSSLFSQSRFENWINGKLDTQLEHKIFSFITNRRFLEAQDSKVKVQLTSNYFIKNILQTLMSSTNPNGAMKKDDALAYINEKLTGDSFDKALVSAKSIIDEVNSKQKNGNVLKDNKEAVYRFAMGIVKQNLASDRVLSLEEIESLFKAAYKSAGRDIGHESNNMLTDQVNNQNQRLNKKIEDAIRNKHYGIATMNSALYSIFRFTVAPFVGGGTNWIVLQSQKSGLSPMSVLGLIQTISDYTNKQPYELDLNTEIGRKNYVNSLYRKTNYESSMARMLVGTVFGVAIAGAMSINLGGDNDDENDGTQYISDWLDENEWARKYFEKISPTTATWLVAYRNDDLEKFFVRQLNIRTDFYDRNYQVIKSLGNNQNTGAKIVEATTANIISPFAWKTYADAYDIGMGLTGNAPIEKEMPSKNALDAMIKNGAISRGARIIDNFRENFINQ